MFSTALDGVPLRRHFNLGGALGDDCVHLAADDAGEGPRVDITQPGILFWRKSVKITFTAKMEGSDTIAVRYIL